MRSRKNYRKITKKRKYKKLGRNYKNSRRSTTQRQYKKLKKSRKYTRKGNYKNKKLVIRRNRVMKGGDGRCKYYDYTLFNGENADDGICKNNGFNEVLDGTNIVLCHSHYVFITEPGLGRLNEIKQCNNTRCSKIYLNSFKQKKINEQYARTGQRHLEWLGAREWCGSCIIKAIWQVRRGQERRDEARAALA